MTESPDTKWVVDTFTGVQKLRLGIVLHGGLCELIEAIDRPALISEDVRATMLRRIDTLADAAGTLMSHSYLWPRTQDGWAERAKFCREMAQ